jgi:hypothetical protein
VEYNESTVMLPSLIVRVVVFGRFKTGLTDIVPLLLISRLDPILTRPMEDVVATVVLIIETTLVKLVCADCILVISLDATRSAFLIAIELSRNPCVSLSCPCIGKTTFILVL